VSPLQRRSPKRLATVKEKKKMRYKAINAGVLPCGICGKPMKKGEWIMETFIQVYHDRCYRRARRSSAPRINPRKLFERDLQKMAKRMMRRK